MYLKPSSNGGEKEGPINKRNTMLRLEGSKAELSRRISTDHGAHDCRGMGTEQWLKSIIQEMTRFCPLLVLNLSSSEEGEGRSTSFYKYLQAKKFILIFRIRIHHIFSSNFEFTPISGFSRWSPNSSLWASTTL